MTMILARRIPSPLAGAADCGPNQQWDPNYVMPGLPPGQCTPKGTPMTAAPGVFDTFMSSIFPKPVTPAPMMTPMVIRPTGMSQTTMIALGLGAVGILALVLATRDSGPKQNPARSRRGKRSRRDRNFPRPRKPRLGNWVLTWVHDDGSTKTDAFTFTSKSAAQTRGASLVGRHGIVSYRIRRSPRARQFARNGR